MGDRHRMSFLQLGAAVLTWGIVTVFALYLADRGGNIGARLALSLDGEYAVKVIELDHARKRPS